VLDVSEDVSAAESPVTDIIVIKQLPEIEERLKEISEAAQVKIAEALALECNNESIQAVKKLRTALRNDFDALEEQRKEVNRQIKKQLEPFTDAYKKFVTDIYTPADATLKARIDTLEDEKKARMREEVKAYFDELVKHHGIDFASFDVVGINVTLSSTATGLKKQAKAFIDKVCDDLALIATQEHKAEILVAYRESLNVSLAITSVRQRMEAVEAEKRREEEAGQRRQAAKEAAQRVDEVLPPPVADVLEPPTQSTVPPVAAEKILTLSFTVRGSIDDLRALKRHIEAGPLEIIK